MFGSKGVKRVEPNEFDEDIARRLAARQAEDERYEVNARRSAERQRY